MADSPPERERVLAMADPALLPPDALIAIASFLLPSANDLSSMASVCSAWRSLWLPASTPLLPIPTLHFRQSFPHSFTHFSQAIARAFPSTVPLQHLQVSFSGGSSHAATFTWLAAHASLQSLTFIEERLERNTLPIFAVDNWPMLGSLDHLNCLTFLNYMIDLDSGLVLEGDELEEDVYNDRSGVKVAPGNENLRLDQLHTLTLMWCDIESGGLAVLLEHYCTPQAFTLEFPFLEQTRVDPHKYSAVLDVYGPRLKYLSTVGPSNPHPHVLRLKTGALQSVVLHNYEAVQFDLDSFSLESLTVRSSMDVSFETATPLLHYLDVQGENWMFEVLVQLLEDCSHVKTLRLDFSCYDYDLEIDILHTFVHLQGLFMGSDIFKVWAEEPWDGALLLPTLESLELQEVKTKSEVQLLRRLLEAAPSLESLIISDIDEETLGDVKDLLSQYMQVEHNLGS